MRVKARTSPLPVIATALPARNRRVAAGMAAAGMRSSPARAGHSACRTAWPVCDPLTEALLADARADRGDHPGGVVIQDLKAVDGRRRRAAAQLPVGGFGTGHQYPDPDLTWAWIGRSTSAPRSTSAAAP